MKPSVTNVLEIALIVSKQPENQTVEQFRASIEGQCGQFTVQECRLAYHAMNIVQELIDATAE